MLHVKEHEIFQRDGDDLLCEVPVSFVQAALGAEIEVPTLEGKATIKIPAGTQPGTLFRVKGKGVKNLQGYGHGDLHVRVQVEVPTHLNGAQKAKLQEFAALCDEKQTPLSQGFFEKAKKFFKSEWSNAAPCTAFICRPNICTGNDAAAGWTRGAPRAACSALETRRTRHRSGRHRQ